ncbi:unnamed protein product, partial [Mesorhabditis spiculigera]
MSKRGVVESSDNDEDFEPARASQPVVGSRKSKRLRLQNSPSVSGNSDEEVEPANSQKSIAKKGRRRHRDYLNPAADDYDFTRELPPRALHHRAEHLRSKRQRKMAAGKKVSEIGRLLIEKHLEPSLVWNTNRLLTQQYQLDYHFSMGTLAELRNGDWEAPLYAAHFRRKFAVRIEDGIPFGNNHVFPENCGIDLLLGASGLRFEDLKSAAVLFQVEDTIRSISRYGYLPLYEQDEEEPAALKSYTIYLETLPELAKEVTEAADLIGLARYNQIYESLRAKPVDRVTDAHLVLSLIESDAKLGYGEPAREDAVPKSCVPSCPLNKTGTSIGKKGRQSCRESTGNGALNDSRRVDTVDENRNRYQRKDELAVQFWTNLPDFIEYFDPADRPSPEGRLEKVVRMEGYDATSSRDWLRLVMSTRFPTEIEYAVYNCSYKKRDKEPSDLFMSQTAASPERCLLCRKSCPNLFALLLHYHTSYPRLCFLVAMHEGDTPEPADSLLIEIYYDEHHLDVYMLPGSGRGLDENELTEKDRRRAEYISSSSQYSYFLSKTHTNYFKRELRMDNLMFVKTTRQRAVCKNRNTVFADGRYNVALLRVGREESERMLFLEAMRNLYEFNDVDPDTLRYFGIYNYFRWQRLFFIAYYKCLKETRLLNRFHSHILQLRELNQLKDDHLEDLEMMLIETGDHDPKLHLTPFQCKFSFYYRSLKNMVENTSYGKCPAAEREAMIQRIDAFLPKTHRLSAFRLNSCQPCSMTSKIRQLVSAGCAYPCDHQKPCLCSPTKPDDGLDENPRPLSPRSKKVAAATASEFYIHVKDNDRLGRRAAKRKL